ncbi:RsmB/NOP family class I SAM-dependent RNA methyltransferase [Marinibacterium profundimaris]|uniref:SAM-dependent methlyltransferase n=1 Tax=Marinibacterium profundimaris TaxID=1679460 RepID=A0A225NV96_9RHOB|nr:RsmB/NOP family class I SAM-dependent RNA methyltransferase [Marinibacterium profundimaris]OWU77367.1 SAM-dependent methlyltransferase [Marinibacterium profundimaris]
MTPAARVQAAIEVLDRIGSGAATEQALTAWARGARYAGSKDRAAVRDHVFGAIRCRRSFAALGGGTDGRSIMIGALRAAGLPLDEMFSGAPHAPAPLSAAERAAGHAPEGTDRLDLPDWLWPLFQESLGDAAEPAALALRGRAGVHLRVNTACGDRDSAIARLAEDGVTAQPHPAATTALAVTEGARRIRQGRAYAEGLVELQDAASQALVEALPLRPGQSVLDYCAGGGGKALAMAATGGLTITAHDADPRRMRDLPARADRAGAAIGLAETGSLADLGPFDLVLCDAPCSGSGSWRRAPDAKWDLTPDRLDDLCALQAEILDAAVPLVAPGGVLAYATCSVLRPENGDQIAGFLVRHGDWSVQSTRDWPVTEGDLGTDGFHLSVLTRKS